MQEEVRKILKSKLFGSKIHYFPETGSTNDEAIHRAKAGGQEGEVFIADSQKTGRGRHGKTWDSPPGKNIYISFLLKPIFASDKAPLLTLVAGAAAFETVASLLPEAVRGDLTIKWPNDLYFRDKKLCGILTEVDLGAEDIRWVVTGIGLNLNCEPEDLGPQVQATAVSVRQAAGREQDRVQVTARLIEAMETRYLDFCQKGPGDILDFCNRHSCLLGKKVRTQIDGGEVVGTADLIDAQGRLSVKAEDGILHTVIGGDVTWELA